MVKMTTTDTAHNNTEPSLKLLSKEEASFFRSNIN